jgi:hypothetical protein
MDKKERMKKPSAGTILVVVYCIVIAIGLIILNSSCNTPKSAQRKDDKAVGRVVSKDHLLAKVAKYINTGGDTVTVVSEKVVHDTLNVPQPVYPQTCVFATDHAIDTILPNGIRLSITNKGIVATYTVRQQRDVIQNRAAERRWQDSANAWQYRYFEAQSLIVAQREQNNILQRSLESAQEQIRTTKKKGWPTWAWLAIGIVVGAGGATVALRKAIPLLVIRDLAMAFIGLFKGKKKDK